VTRRSYSSKRISAFVKDYFKNSYSELVSFFTREKDISISEMEEIIRIMDKELKNKNMGKNE
jgi:hypothetical protein